MPIPASLFGCGCLYAPSSRLGLDIHGLGLFCNSFWQEVYGEGEGSQDSKAVVGKLKTAGHINVMEPSPDFAGWHTAGFPLRGYGNLPKQPVLHGSFHINSAESIIRWTGRNLFHHHSGTVKLPSGSIALNGEIDICEFSIDLNSIACEDIADSAMNAMLILYLRDADLFEVGKFSAATFEATEALPIETCTPGSPNDPLRGNLTLRGVSEIIEFRVVIASADGERITGQGQPDLDSARFGSICGTGRLFDSSASMSSMTSIHLRVKVHAEDF